MSCINDKNLLCHEFLFVSFKDDSDPWGFVIHDGDCRTDLYDGGSPVLSCHPKLLARTMEKLMKRNGRIQDS